MPETARILIVEDDAKHGTMCARLLERKGYHASAVTSGKEALTRLESNSTVDVVLADLQMPEMDGIQLLAAVKSRFPHTEFIVMTGYGTVKTAVEAMQLGAAHYIQKPLDPEELNLLIQRVMEKKHLEAKVDRLRAELQGKYSFDNVIGRSAAMQTVFDKMTAACGNKATVLITGESGTGKELVARGIHYNTFKDDAPFVAVNCGALPKDLIESELFGYKRGAFTGASGDSEGLFCAAEGGTMFLDEVMEMPPELQVKLMRVLQERKIRHLGETREIPINVRVIAATNKPIAEALESGAIRKDLYYRLSVITIHIPPLRERGDDIAPLVEHFLTKHHAAYNSIVKGIEPQALEALAKYQWPGNVRELENLVEMLLAYARSPKIRVSDLPERFGETAAVGRKGTIGNDEVSTLKDAERRLIINALSRSKGNKSHAALMLGISRKSLYKKLADYNIPE